MTAEAAATSIPRPNLKAIHSPIKTYTGLLVSPPAIMCIQIRVDLLRLLKHNCSRISRRSLVASLALQDTTEAVSMALLRLGC